VDNEKQVVKNEKRQGVDNRPYGHNFYIINKALYPEDHPYNWQVIGSLEDLDAATLQDVKDFYRRWYVPNNVTVTITGDFDPDQAKIWVDKYFSEIPRGADIDAFAPRASTLAETQSLYYEDNFAKVPRLTMVWPTVEQYHQDGYALDILSEYLASGKLAPFNQVMIDEKKLTSDVTFFNNSAEIAGEFYLIVDGNAGADLDQMTAAIRESFERFEKNGISNVDLDRIKTGLEVDVYNQVQSALGKAIQLAEYNVYKNDPGYFTKDIEGLLNVTTEDVMFAYERYIKDKPFLVTSIVPKGSVDLALANARKATIVEEKIVQGAEAVSNFDPKKREFDPTPSSFDRTVEPPFGPAYKLPQPVVWRDQLGSDIAVFGIENAETPLVNFSLSIDAGRARATAQKPGVANLLADMLEKGTANRTTAELEDAIKSLGSTISVIATPDHTLINGTTLERNFAATVELVEEMLLEPRWDAEEFDILKRRVVSDIDQAAGNPNAIAQREVSKLSYNADHVFHYRPFGTKAQLQKTSLDDLKDFYQRNYVPANANLRVVGKIDQKQVRTGFSSLANRWKGTPPPSISLPQANEVEQSKIYFYDVPGAKQSVLNISRPSLTAKNPDYPSVRAMNYLLGNIYTSRLNTALRVEKGYTYGIGSNFAGGADRGRFSIRSSVRSNVTLEALTLIRDIVRNYGPGFTQQDLNIMKGALLRGQALNNETLQAKLGVLIDISDLDYPDNYQALDAERVKTMSLGDFKRLAEKYLRTDAMNWLVVGDRETQADRLKELGFGDVVILPKVER